MACVTLKIEKNLWLISPVMLPKIRQKKHNILNHEKHFFDGNHVDNKGGEGVQQRITSVNKAQ